MRWLCETTLWPPALNAVAAQLLSEMSSVLHNSHARLRCLRRLAYDQGAVGLEARLNHRPNQLSGGQQQRVAIARALINDPSLLLADEPTGNLDTRTSLEVMDLFQQLNRTRGITVVLITHEPDIAAHASRIVSFRDGRVQSDRLVAEPRAAAGELLTAPAAA
jgi:putative ABC transport system ATP-binding protein